MKKLLIFLPALLLVLAACNSTRITSSWKADDTPANGYKKIMVLGILKQKDRTLRESLEKQLVKNLESQGYTAASAMQVYGPKAFDKIKEEDIAEQLRSSGYDAVITTALLDKSKEEYYQPGRLSYRPVGIARFGRYYTTVYDRVYDPGYYSNSTQYFLESNMYDLKSGDLVYSVQSKAADPSSVASLGKDYSKTIVKDLKEKQVLAGTK